MIDKIKIIFFIIPFFCFGKNLTLETRLNPPARELMDIHISDSIMIIPGNLDGYDFFDISDQAFSASDSRKQCFQEKSSE